MTTIRRLHPTYRPFCVPAILALTLSGCLIVGGSDPDPVVVELSEGETHAVPGDGASITFVAELNDSRCPIDVTCVTEGFAEVSLRLDTARGRFDFSIAGFVGPEGSEAETNRASGLVERIGGYEVTLLRLDPYPDTSVTNPAEPHAVLRVEVL